MFFSEKFNVDRKIIEEYGAIDISLVCDLPLFIDPMLIFNSSKDEYKELHEYLIKFFSFLTEKSEEGVDVDEINAYFMFHEVKNNWFGYSKVGNGGRGLGEQFATFLSKNLKFIMEDNGITKSKHIEKALLIYDGNGKDKISDLTTNLILNYLATYTQNFAQKYIENDKIGYFNLDSLFNFKTQSFENIEYRLPYFINKNGEREFVLLTPRDILREEDPAISKANFKKMYDRVRIGISNQAHRAQLNNYIARAVNEYRSEQKNRRKKITDIAIEKVEKEAFFKALKEKEFSWLYDYFIKIIEESGNEINEQATNECLDQIKKFYLTSEQFKKLLNDNKNNFISKSSSAREELLNKIKFLKDTIENKEGYKLLYHNGKRIASEDTLQRLFRFTLYGTPYDFNFDANNGSGEYDVKASFGSQDVCIAEFKLASNSQLTHIFSQTKIYEKANKSKDSLYVIFCFDTKDKEKLSKLLRENKQFKEHSDSIISIDCTNNKKPASKV